MVHNDSRLDERVIDSQYKVTTKKERLNTGSNVYTLC